MPHIFQNDRTGQDGRRDYRLDDKPGGYMLVHPLHMFRNTQQHTHLARCDACNVESTHTAGAGDSLRLAFETSTAHNDEHHPPVPEGALF